jgi:hypothetical protein
MLNDPELPKIDMAKRSGESATDVSEWDNSTIEFDASTGIYSVDGEPILKCQGVALYQDENNA